MKREEYQAILLKVSDLLPNIPFEIEARNEILNLLCIPGVAAELKTILYAVKNEKSKS